MSHNNVNSCQRTNAQREMKQLKEIVNSQWTPLYEMVLYTNEKWSNHKTWHVQRFIRIFDHLFKLYSNLLWYELVPFLNIVFRIHTQKLSGNISERFILAYLWWWNENTTRIACVGLLKKKNNTSIRFLWRLSFFNGISFVFQLD